MPLTDAAIRRAKPAAKPQKLADGGGLFLFITVAGAKSWRWKYRVAGKEKLFTLGPYPDVSLPKAREAREAREGRCSSAAGQRRRSQRAAQGRSCHEGRRPRRELRGHRARVAGRSAMGAGLPEEGRRLVRKGRVPLPGLTARRRSQGVGLPAGGPPDGGREAFESAHRIMQNCGQVMRYAVATDRAERNPVADLRGALIPPPEKNHSAVVDPVQLGGLLRALHVYHGTSVVQAALKLAPMLFVRPGELRQAEWTEVDLDAASGAFRLRA